MGGKPNFDDIELKQDYTMTKSYSFSKLYVIWMMRHLDAELKKSGVRNIAFNMVHPASTQTSLGREATNSLKWRIICIIYFLWKPMMISVTKGAGSSKAAVWPELKGVTGKYYGPKGEDKVNDKNYSAANEHKV